MPKEEGVEVDGTITEALSNGNFTVELTSGQKVLAHIGGKMRKFYIRVAPGDQVKVELSPYDLSRGRITWLLGRERRARGAAGVRTHGSRRR